MSTYIKSSIKILFFTITLLSSSTKVVAQNQRINPSTQLASEIDAMGHLNKKLKWQCDFQYSRQSPYESLSFLKYGEQFSVRPWIHYYPQPTIKLSAFVGLWYNFKIDGNVGQRNYPEYRTSIQAQFYKVWGVNTLSNRFRSEIREIKNKNGQFETAFRERYLLKYQRLLKHQKYDKGSSYGILSNELLLNVGSTITGYKTFDQYRVFIGLGYNITDDISIETGYFNQFSYHAHDTNFDMNHTLQVSFIIDNLTI